MENKLILINVILDRHILTDNLYNSVFNVFHKEYNINLLKTDAYNSDINAYKHALKTKLSQYFDKIYIYEELSEMSLDSNSPYFYRMINEEYKGLISHETRIFSTRLREKFAEDGVSKKTFLQTLWQSTIDFFK